MMNRHVSKFLLLISALGVSTLSSAYTLKEKLDYCATADSWAAQIILSELTTQGKHFEKSFNPDVEKVTSRLISTEKIKDGDKPIFLSEYGDLYIQTIMVTIPFKDGEFDPFVILSSSIISPEECSLTRPSYIPLKWNLNSQNLKR